MASEAITDPGPFKPGDVCEGRYRIVRRLKAGGVGVVYEAEHCFTGLSVALKALYNRAGDHHERMRLEARALAEIRHPYVVRITDGGVTSDGVIWFTMELLDGRSLRGELNDVGALGVERALRFGIQIALGVQAAHDRDVIHRDLKPENVFVVEPGDSIRVLDFGTSKFRSAQLKTTDRFRMLGSHAYMSPERLRANVTDRRGDVYGLGHILYEMVAGRHCLSEGPGPLDFPPPYELGIRQIYAVPVPLTERAPGTPADVSDIVQRALAKKPDDRQPSMSALAGELEGALVRHFGSGAITWMDATALSPKPAVAREATRRDSRPRVIPREQVPSGLSSPAVAQPIIYTDRVPPHELPDAQLEHRIETADTQPGAAAEPGSARSAPAEARSSSASSANSPAALDAALLIGAAHFAVSPGMTSRAARALATLASSVQQDASASARLRALVAHLSRIDERGQAHLRQLVMELSADRDPAATLKSSVRIDGDELPLDRQAGMTGHCSTALGCALLVEPDVRLEAAENALHALDRADEDVQSFALSILVAFGRSDAREQAAARGALLALLLGGSEDTELARAELASFVLRSAEAPIAESGGAPPPARPAVAPQVAPLPAVEPIAAEPTLASIRTATPSLGAGASAAGARHTHRAQPRRDATAATPNTMTTPVAPVGARDTPSGGVRAGPARFSIPVAAALALGTSAIVMVLGLRILGPRAPATQAASSTASRLTPSANASVAAAPLRASPSMPAAAAPSASVPSMPAAAAPSTSALPRASKSRQRRVVREPAQDIGLPYPEPLPASGLGTAAPRPAHHRAPAPKPSAELPQSPLF
jgi:serine/threonine protein kinase